MGAAIFGLCLPHCPTYQRDRVESRGPRGRIALIAAINASRDWLTASAAADLDSCLSCLRCQQACPAQVRYGELIDHARNRWRPIKRPARLLLWLSARPRLLARLTAMVTTSDTAGPMSAGQMPNRNVSILPCAR